MDAVRTIGECDAFQVQRAAQGGTSRVRWAIELAVAAVFEVAVEDLRGNHLERAVSCLLDALSMRHGRG